MLAFGVAAFAAFGSVCRYVVDGVVREQTNLDDEYPWATLIVNVVGSLVLGLATGLAVHYDGWKVEPVLLIGAGFAGGFTTWSTLMWELLALDRRAQRSRALRYLAVTVVLGLLAAAIGLTLAAHWPAGGGCGPRCE